MTTALLDTSKGVVEYTYKGVGPVVLLLKGGHCTRETDLSHGSLVYEGYSLLTISRPGYDGTDISTGRTPDAFADTIIEVLNHLRLEKVHVIAVSAAGPTGIALALHHPDRVSKLIMEAAMTMPWEEKVRRRAQVLFGPAEKVFWKSLKTMLTLFPDLVIKQMLAELTTKDADHIVRELSTNDRRFIYDMIATSRSGKGFRTDLRHQVPVMDRLEVPVLGMYSHYDRSVPYAHAVLLKSNVRDCEIFEVDSDSHLIWIGSDAQEVWNKRLEFLNKP
ncbi:alpha/beta hydrolase [Halobacillus sp. ACCC02827]|uniref:alpha/beta fold hydrolase n=1 Tax=Bacillaceae TaxID=186817 RepID=UPI0002A4FDC9|nr:MULTISPECIES: alpha/beta hydrolase [Bacillaceae]ELK47625.1 aromatic hydrocarbon catabolism protein [Halobacillus sp. BAB-2008]QHT45937.1 alpha/beta hydrolase [Bacillus sp. SB49]WJE16747.1 alpha/beta hydrolase [Halobacillus sp. ACCC02827]